MTNFNPSAALTDLFASIARDMDANLDWTPRRAQIIARVDAYFVDPATTDLQKEMICAVIFDRLSI